jgi:beta,beta-carotene 9',10'-dioxygenase
MMTKIVPALALIFCACSSKPTPQQKFYDKHLFFDVNQEVENVSCPIEGQIPSWLSGTLLRNGPAKFEAGGKRVQSWFDGLAMLHAFSFTANEVRYSNRFLRSKQYYRMVVEGNLDFEGFAQDPCSKKFRTQVSSFVPSEMENIKNAVVSIADYEDKMVALTENPLPVVFDPATLKTLGNFPYADDLPKEQIFESAHPQYDPLKEENINYLTEFGKDSFYVIWKMKNGARDVLAKIAVDRPSYMHSFALTENYVVLVEFPFVVNPLSFILSHKPFIQNFKWKPKRGTVFLVVERATGKTVGTFKTDPFFAFHHVNAFERNGNIHIDIITYKDAEVIQEVSLTEPGKEPIATKMERFTLSLSEPKLLRETIFERSIEMPKVPASKAAQEYRYAYAVDYILPEAENDVRPLYKVDVQSKIALSWSQAGCFPGEPIFVPRPGSTEEDDGVVLSLVLDLPNQSSFLLLLDAKDFHEIAKAKAPFAIPVGLHGYWRY